MARHAVFISPKKPLADFTTNMPRLLVLSAFGLVIGALAGLVAFVLLRLIGLITNLVYYGGRFSFQLSAPTLSHLGWLTVFIPVVGGIVVGFIARYGTDKIRGHGIPEAIQNILEHGSCMEGRVALFKPIGSAITIGTGGPFGAEGPIIMTGGAFGSLIAQFFSMSAAERRTLLVAGAAGGMSATFGAPISSVMIAVELLLFEWKPRSLVPVALASIVAYGVRYFLLGPGPVFGTPPTAALAPPDLIWAIAVGLAAGIGSGLLTKAVYLVEDAYRKLPIHWMWWPAIGGIFVGLGGLVVPQALGVGYPTIRAIDSGHVLLGFAVALLVVKMVIWCISLSSGTSGGVLAPLLMMGGAIGAICSAFIPGHNMSIWATVGMAAMLGGTMRAPFTATIFTMETTHNWALILPVFFASVAGMVVTIAWVGRSILTEKVARHGTHVAREYAVHPLEGLAVRDVMTPSASVRAARPETTVAAFAKELQQPGTRPHIAYPVVSEDGEVFGMVHYADIMEALHSEDGADSSQTRLQDIIDPVHLIESDERASTAVEVMGRSGARHLLVVDESGHYVGLLSQYDLLKGWQRFVDSEERRETVLRFNLRHQDGALREGDKGSGNQGGLAGD